MPPQFDSPAAGLLGFTGILLFFCVAGLKFGTDFLAWRYKRKQARRNSK